MARARFLLDRTVTTGNRWNAPATVISASSSVPALPAAASQNPDRSYIWRSNPSTGEAHLRVDLGSALAFNVVAVANVKLVGTGVVKLQELGTGGAPGAAVDVATLPAMDAVRKITYIVFGSQTKRHVQLLFTNPTAANDYAEAGYVALGTYFEPGSNFRVPIDLPYTDRSVPRMAEGGQKTFAQREPVLGAQLQFDDLLEADFTHLQDLYQIVRIGTPLFMVLDTARSWMNLLGRFTGFTPVEALAPGRLSLSLGIEEAL